MNKYDMDNVAEIEREQDRIDVIFERAMRWMSTAEIDASRYLNHLADKFRRLDNAKIALLNK